MSIGTFGEVVFEASAERVRTWQSFQRANSARVTAHEVLEEKPRLEFLGPGLDEITLQVRLDVSFGIDPSTEIDILRDVRDKGAAKLLVIGGKNIGRFALESIEEEWRTIDHAGRLIQAVVTLKLKEYADKSRQGDLVSQSTYGVTGDITGASAATSLAVTAMEKIGVIETLPAPTWKKMLSAVLAVVSRAQTLLELGIRIRGAAGSLQPDALLAEVIGEIARQPLADQIRSLKTIFGDDIATEIVTKIEWYR